MEDPEMRLAVREFNGDYNPKLLNELDAGAKIPDACFNSAKTVRVPAPCPPCDKKSVAKSVARSVGSAEEESRGNKDNTIDRVSYILLVVAVIVLLYHIYKINFTEITK
jgi:hypothetical protein